MASCPRTTIKLRSWYIGEILAGEFVSRWDFVEEVDAAMIVLGDLVGVFAGEFVAVFGPDWPVGRASTLR